MKKTIPSIHVPIQKTDGSMEWVWYMYLSNLAESGGETTVSVNVDSTETTAPGSDAEVINVGDEVDVKLKFKIPRGAQGEQGSQGPSGTITVGTTTTLPAGSSATVTNVGTSTDAIFNFGIPKGENGQSVDAYTKAETDALLNAKANNTNRVNGAPLSNTTSTFYGVSDTAAATAQKEVSIPSITTLDVGTAILVKPTVTSTVAYSSIKLNDFPAYPMYYAGSAISTSTNSIVWAANTPSWWVFDGTYWVFAGHGLDSNTTYILNYSVDAGQYTAGSGNYAITRYSIIAQKPNGTWEKITATDATYSIGTSKSVNTSGFILNQLRYYGATTTIASGVKVDTNVVYEKAASVDMCYSTNCGVVTNWALGDYIYLVGTIGVDGLFYLDTTAWWTNTLPSTNDGKLYIRLGLVLSNTGHTMSFFDDRPIFYHDGTGIKEYTGIGDGTITITQGGVSKGTFTTNQSSNTTIALDAGGSSVDIDNSTITKNVSDELQAVATINANTATGATNPIYDWVGTLAEYNTQNIESLHPDWMCYITDDVSGGLSVYTKTQVDNLLAGKANTATTLAGYGITNGVAKGHEVIAFQSPINSANNTWYRKYADGWVEMGGCVAGYSQSANTQDEAFVLLPVTLAAITNSVIVSFITNGGNTTGLRNNYNTLTTSTLSIGLYTTTAITSNYVIYWEVKGIAA